jgi:CheY-like chemotaxis protein
MWLVTGAGRGAWEADDAAIPEEYRRLLWLIDVEGDMRAIRELLREHPAEMVSDWLHELQELGLLESRARSGEPDTTIPLVLSESDTKAGAEAAGLLSRTGAYLAPRRSSSPKSSVETTILIVEDDPDQLALADLRVSTAGYTVRTATSVEGFMRTLLRDGLPDLVLLDVMLPDGNGFDVLSKLRRHPVYGTLPVVMLTVVSDAAYVVQGLALGADGYVTKPYSKNILVGVIKGVLG